MFVFDSVFDLLYIIPLHIYLIYLTVVITRELIKYLKKFKEEGAESLYKKNSEFVESEINNGNEFQKDKDNNEIIVTIIYLVAAIMYFVLSISFFTFELEIYQIYFP